MLSKSDVPYPVIHCDGHTVTIREKGIPDKILIVVITVAPREKIEVNDVVRTPDASAENVDESRNLEDEKYRGNERNDAGETATGS